MTIIVTGGGSGGHITPILAVAHELKQLRPELRIVYVGQRGDGLSDVPARDPNIDAVTSVSAGKFRRYHGEGLRQLLDIHTVFLNARDVFRVLRGLGQSYQLLKRERPVMIFIKGGFVGVPVGLAAAWLRIPFVTHDSDAIPGLANRIIARWAARHAVALPKDIYHYPAEKTVTVGVPVTKDFVPVTAAKKQQYRRELELADDAQLLFVIGGGLGAQRINRAVSQNLAELLAQFPKLQVVHGVGRANEAAMNEVYDQLLPAAQRHRVCVAGYLHDVFRYSGAADVVITRAGATNLAEFAVQGKACIVIPSPFLAGGHQLKNAAILAEHQACEQVSEAALAADPRLLGKAVAALLRDAPRQAALGKHLSAYGNPAAARHLAQLLLQEVTPA